MRAQKLFKGCTFYLYKVLFAHSNSAVQPVFLLGAHRGLYLVRSINLASELRALNLIKIKIFLRPILVLTVLLGNLAFQEIAVAVTINSGDCASEVTSSTGVQYASTSTDCYLAFTTVGANVWTPPSGLTRATFLIIAGGGAGGSGAWGGGGGAGGVVYYENYTVSNSSPLNLSVGSGGAAGGATNNAATNRSSNGGNSWINTSSTIVAKGGGAGASYAYGQSGNDADGNPIQNGKSGGSGGGGTEFGSGSVGGTSNQSSISGAIVYGFTGGSTSYSTSCCGAGGGGGSGGVGSNNQANQNGGNGGPGINTYSTLLNQFSPAFGVSGFIAGGGGGGANYGTSDNHVQASGGSGGGGGGGWKGNRNGSAGAANTGSGGGGASYSGWIQGSNGGSGLIIIKFAKPSTTPSAPTSLTATAGDGQATISFTAGSDGGSAITNYKYSTDGTNYTALSPTDATTPITISGLTNGTSYTIYLKAVNANGDSAASSSVTVTPSTTPSAPTSLTATAGDGQATISFTAGSDGGSAITNYKYSTDGTNYSALSPADSSSPITISGLTNGTSYAINLKAVNTNGDSAASSSVSVTPVAPAVSASDSTGPNNYFEPIRKVEVSNGKINWEPNRKVVISKYDPSSKKSTIIESVNGQLVLPKAKPGQSVSYSIMATDGTVLKEVIMKTKPNTPKIAKVASQKSEILTKNKKIAITAQWKKDDSVKRYVVKITLDNGKSITASTSDPNFSIITDETKGATITITAVGKNNLTSTVTRKI